MLVYDHLFAKEGSKLVVGIFKTKKDNKKQI